MSLRDRLVRVVPVTLVCALVLWWRTLDNDDYCGTVGECLGAAFDDMIVVGLSLLLGPLVLWACRLPRVLAHTAAVLVTLFSLWYAASEVVTGGDSDRPLPLVVAVLVAVVAAVAATYVCGPGDWRPRVAVLVAGPLLATAAHLVVEQAQLSGEAEELERTGLTLYTPVIAGEEPSHAYVLDGVVNLSYTVELEDRLTSVDVMLSAEPIDAPAVNGRVEVEREGAVLTADFDPASMDADEIRTALEQADPRPASDLAD